MVATRTVGGAPLVVARGTPEELGAAYAEQAGDAIEANLATYLGWFRYGGLDRDQLRQAGLAFRAETVRRHPRIAAMVDGLAGGLGRPPEDLYVLNGRSELLARITGSAGGCTSLARGTTLAQTWDWTPAMSDAVLVLATEDEHGHRVLALTEAGMLAKAGLSSAGVGVCINMLQSSGDGGTGGLPYHVIVRAVLESPSFLDAALTAATAERSASINLLIGSRTGELVDLELAPQAAGWVTPTEGALAHGNHFETAVPVEDRLIDPAQLASSHHRSATAARFLQDGGGELAAVLRHHGEHGICVHPDESMPIPLQTATLASVVLRLDEGAMAVAAGLPCTADYEVVTLDQVFGAT